MLRESNLNYKAQAGGAPANVSFVVKRLGGNTELITTLGNDYFGKYLFNLIKDEGIETKNINIIDKKTMLAFVDLDESGDREFSFYDNDTADKHLVFNHENLEDNAIIHFCSVSLQNENNVNLHLKIVNQIRENNGIVSFDPNLRFSLWENRFDELKLVVLQFLKLSNLVKVSEEELLWITNIEDEKLAAKEILNYGVECLLVTKGNLGTTIYKNNFCLDVNGFKVDVVDTTGAGDAFIGAVLYKIQLSKTPLNELSNDELESIVRFANKIASISITKNGAIDSYIFNKEIESY